MAMWNKSVTSYDRLQELIKKGDGDFGKLADYEKELAAWQQRKEKRAADKATLAELRTQMLDNLNKTPEDRVAAYDAYAKSFSDSMHADVDPRFQKLERGTDEQANATGMFGSRAYVDTKSELAKDKLATDTDIANQATMAKESLANNDRQFWAGMLDQIDSGARADKITTAQINQSAASTAAQNYAGTLGYYSAKNANRLAEWEAKQARSASYVNAGSNLAGGLLYLYGGKTGGGGTATGGVSAKPTGGGVQRYGQNFSLLN
ncbi:hypothetical protein [Geobacter sp.]|uniref:hypothetical protein n=1 Tax=Geobacter sp. TaxID=46610 RepID=UPI0026325B36|nr:hypothetical protein [Geobacter sp.]